MSSTSEEEGIARKPSGFMDSGLPIAVGPRYNIRALTKRRITDALVDARHLPRIEGAGSAMADQQTMVAEPQIETGVETEKQEKKKPKKQPRYHVILWDDADHSYDYVVLMMKRLFRHPIETGFQIAKEVDRSGRAICLTTTLEHAELKRDQIHAFGKDELIARCKGSMSATIEPVSK